MLPLDLPFALLGSPPPESDDHGITVALLLGVAATVTAGFGWLVHRLVKFPFWALFVRIRAPEVLDLPQRARILDLVRERPGVRASQVARLLRIRPSHTMYHLQVLQREGFVTRTRAPLRNRYFAGRRLWTPPQMHREAALRDESMSRALRAIQERPGLSVSDLAATLRLSVSNVSRMASRLGEIGLVERRPQGRTLGLWPLDPPAQVPAPDRAPADQPF